MTNVDLIIISFGEEFQAKKAESFLSLFFNNNELKSFAKIWYPVFLWALFSSIVVHVINAAIGFCALRKHKYGRFVPAVVLVMGVVSPLTGGVLTSVAVAGVYRASSLPMPSQYALVWGFGQTFLIVVISFSRILATL